MNISGVSAAPIAPRAAQAQPAQSVKSTQSETSESSLTPTKSPDSPFGENSAPAGRLAPSALNTLLQAQEGRANENGLSEEEEDVVEELKQIDQEVRTHEQAHKSAAGPYAGAISYETTTGPDGREYAVGGHVQIDVSPVTGNPEATIRKMDIVERAALAPAQPSPEDFAVARAAQSARQQAQNELSEKLEEERSAQGDDSSGENGAAQNSILDLIQIDTII